MQFLSPPYILAILVALSVHEWAHGFVAYKLGDPTAKYEGRLTLNPIAHLDPIGTLLFVLIGFGWGKPVPINPRYFRFPKRDIALTAVAGPVSNLILAVLSVVLLATFFPDALGGSAEALLPGGGGIDVSKFIEEILTSSLFLNLALMAFNLLPVAPLDGSKIILAFIPVRFEVAYHQFLQYGPFVLLFLLFSENLIGLPVISLWIYTIVGAFLSLFSAFL